MVSWAWLTEWIRLWKVRVGNQSSGLALRSGASDRRDVFPRLSRWLRGTCLMLDLRKACRALGTCTAIFLAHRLAATKPCADSLIACTKSRFFPYDLHISFSLSPLSCLIVLHVSVPAIPALSPWIETRVCVIVSVRNYFHHAHRIRLYFSFADAPETFLTSHPSPTPSTTAHTHQNSQS